MRMSSLATDFVRIPIAGDEEGQAADPTLGSALELAFIAPGADPGDDDWHAGEWETDTTTEPPSYYARLLIGPDADLTLEPGTYDGWVRWTDNPEKPVLHALGFLHVF
jgi:hypothetical protein